MIQGKHFIQEVYDNIMRKFSKKDTSVVGIIKSETGKEFQPECDKHKKDFERIYTKLKKVYEKEEEANDLLAKIYTATMKSFKLGKDEDEAFKNIKSKLMTGKIKSLPGNIMNDVDKLFEKAFNEGRKTIEKKIEKVTKKEDKPEDKPEKEGKKCGADTPEEKKWKAIQENIQNKKKKQKKAEIDDSMYFDTYGNKLFYNLTVQSTATPEQINQAKQDGTEIGEAQAQAIKDTVKQKLEGAKGEPDDVEMSPEIKVEPIEGEMTEVEMEKEMEDLDEVNNIKDLIEPEKLDEIEKWLLRNKTNKMYEEHVYFIKSGEEIEDSKAEHDTHVFFLNEEILDKFVELKENKIKAITIEEIDNKEPIIKFWK